MSIHDDGLLVDGRSIADVLAEDERQREREQAARDEERFERYMRQSFPQAAQAPRTPEPKPAPDPNRDPDLHGGPRAPASNPADQAFEAYMETFPGVRR